MGGGGGREGGKDMGSGESRWEEDGESFNSATLVVTVIDAPSVRSFLTILV